MGAGHDTVAAELARRAAARGHEPHVADVLRLLPYGLGDGLRRSYQASVRHFPWAYAGVYGAFLRGGRGPRPSGVPLARLAAAALTELVERTDADVVVPVFHLAAQLTGHLRVRGRLRVPSTVFLLDFAVHRQWLHPGNDRYLCLTDGAAAEVRRALGTPAVTTGPAVAPGFRAPAPGAARWRERFAGRAPGRPAVLLSAGAWGAAYRPDATARLLAAAGWLPVVLCGRNARLRARVARVPGALALDWVDDMPGLLAAAYALVDNAAGQTAVQALAAGLPVIGYRPLPGHGTDGVRQMADLGVSDLAPDGPALLSALARLTDGSPQRVERVARGRALFRGDPMAYVTGS
ncbi:MGDG synthase family glycosyltransferase [Streptomyces barringtoniae]|uniref:MGDG synthase family glycosyltransferase n=1 Tax=Streptomyces barringtoniae TaxID=2892029 RepID=UPI001E497EEC|nr:galactosyldiacylglycerol synthase [Streptomyces barringtoniae]MCC5479297.1 galactosyldiacylglycerol synthase [Streptomyces barringtoniae]